MCLYQQYVDHPLGDCWVFQNWMQRDYETRRLALGEDVVLNLPTKSKIVSILHDLRFKKSQDEFCEMLMWFLRMRFLPNVLKTYRSSAKIIFETSKLTPVLIFIIPSLILAFFKIRVWQFHNIREKVRGYGIPRRLMPRLNWISTIKLGLRVNLTTSMRKVT